jgi:hypothetical protein
MSFSDIPEFEGISITSLENNKGEYRIDVSMKEIDSYENARNSAEYTIETLLNMLAYHLQCFISDFRFDVARTVEGKNMTVYPSPLTTHGSAGGTFQNSAAGISELLRNTIDCPYFTMFRHAMQIRDELGKFMGFYNILLSIFNDEQKDIDNFIQTRDPNTPIIPSTRIFKDGRSKIVNETVFTKLRNQVGHFRPGTSLQQTHKEISQNLPAMQSHVVAAIKTKLQTINMCPIEE